MPVIVDDSSGYTEAVEHVILDELDHIWYLYFLQGDGFHPFREVFRYGQDESMSSRCGGLMGPITSIPHISNGMRRMLDEDVLVSHRGSDMHEIA